VAGAVNKVGPGVTSLKVGDRVFGISSLEVPHSDQAGLQEYAILNANAIGKTPETYSDEQVVTLPVNLVTSWLALFTEHGFDIPPPFSKQANEFDYAGTTIVIVGAGTNVAKLAVQLAHIAGIGKIVAIAGSSNRDQLTSFGATHFIDRHDSPADIVAQVQKITGMDGATYVYDCANREFGLASAILHPGKPSRLRTLLPMAAEEAEKFKSQRPQSDAAFIHCNNESMAPYIEEFWTSVPKWLEEKKVLPTDHQVVDGLEKVKDINEALDAYRDGARARPQTVVRVS
jgi:NADPH:quinone reductase-like Zn-dependent oxidoreductase